MSTPSEAISVPSASSNTDKSTLTNTTSTTTTTATTTTTSAANSKANKKKNGNGKQQESLKKKIKKEKPITPSEIEASIEVSTAEKTSTTTTTTTATATSNTTGDKSTPRSQKKPKAAKDAKLKMTDAKPKSKDYPSSQAQKGKTEKEVSVKKSSQLPSQPRPSNQPKKSFADKKDKPVQQEKVSKKKGGDSDLIEKLQIQNKILQEQVKALSGSLGQEPIIVNIQDLSDDDDDMDIQDLSTKRDQKSNQSRSRSANPPSTKSKFNKKDREPKQQSKGGKDKEIKVKESTKEAGKDKREKREKRDKKEKREDRRKSRGDNGNDKSSKSFKKGKDKDKDEQHEEKSEKGNGKRRRVLYRPYIDQDTLKQGLESGKYCFGNLRVNPKKYNDAYITVEGLLHDVYCGGLRDRNRAFNTDIVVFEVLDKKDWKARPKTDGEGEEDHSDSDSDATDSSTILKDITSTVNDIDEGTITLPDGNLALQKKLAIERNLMSETFDGGVIIQDSDADSGSDSESEDEDSDELIILNNPKVESDPETVLLQELNNLSLDKQTTTTTTTTSSTTEDVQVKKSKKLIHPPTISQNQNISVLAKLDQEAFAENLYVSVRVVYILDAKHSKSHVGMITDDPNSTLFANFLPMDTTLPRCCIFKESIPEFKAQPLKYKSLLVSVTYTGWKETSLLPIGTFKKIYGECGQIEPETKALLNEFGVDTAPFPRDVMDCLPKIKNSMVWQPSKKDLATRRDLRNVNIVTIDPDTAKDLDDALHCIPLEDGNFEVGVHIADVSHFVKLNTALDLYAREKATTVYLVQKAIPMLPSLLSEELCSLNMGVERLAFSVIWKLSPEGKILEEWFGRSVIKSVCRLTYGMAQALIDGKVNDSWAEYPSFPERLIKQLGPNEKSHIDMVKASVLGLHAISRHLRNARVSNGAFTIHPSKLAFELDEKGNPVSTKIYPIYESNQLVEEYMLLANMRVAEKIAKSFPANALLRRHPSPNENKLDAFVKFCAKHGYEVDSSSAQSFGDSIKALKEKINDPSILQAIQLLSIRSMKLAEYFCTAYEEEEDWHHYALNVDFYTHFTSPIRRYADVIVHRLLDLSINIEKASTEPGAEQKLGALFQQLQSSELVSSISKHCNEKKLNARKAQERSDKVFLCILLQNNITIADAVVLNTGPSFITCIVPKFGSEQKIYLEDLKTQKLILSHSCSGVDASNIIVWPGLDGSSTNTHTQKISQLSTVKVQITVNKEKFPVDTKCFLVHPLKDI